MKILKQTKNGFATLSNYRNGQRVAIDLRHVSASEAAGQALDNAQARMLRRRGVAIIREF